ncbi:MAG TPA: ATPase, T2SS/T4P/T4SS family, partial [Cellulomonadaceae bacterium]|nr:ATPase, T2SS/T4P/T4SS family [Cellulomonadaceae bacterium]
MSDGTDFFGFAAPVAAPPRVGMSAPVPVQSTPVVPRPAPARPVLVQVHESPALADMDGDGVVSLDEMLTWIIATGASDLHLAADCAPSARVHGALSPIPSTGTISAARLERMLHGIMNERQRAEFEAHNDIDLSYALGHTARFRVNVFRQRGKVGSVMRAIPTEIRTVEDMDIPETIRALAMLPRGLVLVTGPTGSGKALALSTRVPTPAGWTTMGEIQVGDSVLGRDGRPCTVTALSPVSTTPDLYRVTFSDGQTVEADADHQWLVSTHHNRSVPRTRKRTAAIARHAAAHAAAEALDLLATTTGSSGVTVDELFG